MSGCMTSPLNEVEIDSLLSAAMSLRHAPNALVTLLSLVRRRDDFYHEHLGRSGQEPDREEYSR